MILTEVLRKLSKSKLAAFITMTTMGHHDSNPGREINKMLGRAAISKQINNTKAKLIAHIVKQKRKGNVQ